jgi:AraC-like DNA-binding protein
MPYINPDEVCQPAFVLSERYEKGTVPWHTHARGQLVYVSKGVLTVSTEQGMWVVPPLRAIWVPPQVRHCVASACSFWLCTLYTVPSLVTLPSSCTVVAVNPLLRELLLAAAQFGPNYEEGSAEERLIRVMLDRLPTLPLLALHLPEPKDERLQQITRGLARQPSDAHSLADLAKEAGLTERTAERLFQHELGMTFGKWRQQLRLLVALEQLARGESVTNVALAVGYSDVSAFIAMFKSALGITPAQYFRQTSNGS